MCYILLYVYAYPLDVHANYLAQYRLILPMLATELNDAQKEARALFIYVMNITSEHTAGSSLWDNINTVIYGSVVDVLDRVMISTHNTINRILHAHK